MGRPSILTPELIEKAKGYIESRNDNVELTEKGALAFVEVQLPSVADFSQYLGITRQTVYDWCDPTSERYNEEFSYIVEDILAEQEKRLLNNGLGGLYTPKIAGMLLGKHGYTEKSETDITTKGEKIQSSNSDVAALTKQLNDLHRSTGSAGDGGAAGPVGKEA